MRFFGTRIALTFLLMFTLTQESQGQNVYDCYSQSHHGIYRRAADWTPTVRPIGYGHFPERNVTWYYPDPGFLNLYEETTLIPRYEFDEDHIAIPQRPNKGLLGGPISGRLRELNDGNHYPLIFRIERKPNLSVRTGWVLGRVTKWGWSFSTLFNTPNSLNKVKAYKARMKFSGANLIKVDWLEGRPNFANEFTQRWKTDLKPFPAKYSRVPVLKETARGQIAKDGTYWLRLVDLNNVDRRRWYTIYDDENSATK